MDSDSQLRSFGASRQPRGARVVEGSVERDPSAPTELDKDAGFVELIDGSILPMKSIRVDQSKATLTLAGNLVNGASIMRVNPLVGPRLMWPTVPGAVYRIAYKDKLSPEQVTALLPHIRSLAK